MLSVFVVRCSVMAIAVLLLPLRNMDAVNLSYMRLKLFFTRINFCLMCNDFPSDSMFHDCFAVGLELGAATYHHIRFNVSFILLFRFVRGYIIRAEKFIETENRTRTHQFYVSDAMRCAVFFF